MKCERLQGMLAAYVAGELTDAEVDYVEAHLINCAACRDELEAYRLIAGLVADEPMLSPTPAESAALAQALDRVAVCADAEAPANTRVRRELAGLALATAVSFLCMVLLLRLQVLGRIDVVSLIRGLNPFHIAAAAVVAVFVTSFIPILVTARRRPLNGMTFVR